MELANESVPRSDATVRRYAQPVIEMERRADRWFHRALVAVALLILILYFTHQGDLAFSVGAVGVVLAGIWLAISWTTGGKAADVVRNGVAYPAEIELRRGYRGASDMYIIRWTDSAGAKYETNTFKNKGMPAPGSNEVVLDSKNKHAVGVSFADTLLVVARGKTVSR